MKQADYLIYNGCIHLSDEHLGTVNNRSFRYGDGFFETMKMINSTILFGNLHFERFFSSLQTMQFDKPDNFTQAYWLQQIEALVQKNNHSSLSRIRLTVFRGDGNLYDIDPKPNYVIQSYALPSPPSYSEAGFCIDIYEPARKTADAFSAIKNNNYLPYSMAALWSRQHNTDDALVMNNYGRIAEATTSNIFIVKKDKIKTPALSEGCIAGITRRYLLSCFAENNISCEEGELTREEMMDADEIFLTNTGWYIQWVKQCGSKIYSNSTSKYLYNRFITPITERI